MGPGDEIVYETQAEESVVYNSLPMTQRENVAFEDGDAGHSYDLDDYMDPTRMMQDSDDVDLGNFFSRPIKVFSTEWGINLTLAANFNPWSVYFNNPRVVNRISNYNLLRCKMHLKVLVNGTPFHYGLVMFGYNPLDANDSVSSLAGLISQDLVELSQRPKIFINPTTSTGGTMELPFFWYKNYLSIPDAEWNQMGQIYLKL